LPELPLCTVHDRAVDRQPEAPRRLQADKKFMARTEILELFQVFQQEPLPISETGG